MKNSLFPRLAATNIRKNRRSYVPYILTCIFTITMFYLMRSLALNEELGEITATFLKYGTYVIGVFSFIFLFYTNSFLTKNRKKEFGLFNILGMEKKHIARVMGFETVYVMVISLIGGLGLGMLLERLMFRIVARLVGIPLKIAFSFHISAVTVTLAVFAVIFFIIYLNSLRLIHLTDPIQLLKGGNMGEREPKAKWLLAILGAASLGAGYYLALSVQNPIKAIYRFFIAVLLVVVGTYLLFMAGSIAFLKLLKKSKSYYYKTSHFISVSGMMYRMKQNAVGLANICILSTMVLVSVSSTSCLIMGVDDCISSSYPHQLGMGCYGYPEQLPERDVLDNAVKDMTEKFGVKTTYMNTFRYLYFTTIIDGDRLECRSPGDGEAFEDIDTNVLRMVLVTTLEDYNSTTGSTAELGDNEIILYNPDSVYDYDTVNIFDTTYTIKARTEDFIEIGAYNNLCDTLGIVVKDIDTFSDFYYAQEAVYGPAASPPELVCWFDLDCDNDGQKEFFDYMMRHINEYGIENRYTMTNRAEQSEAMKAFVGTFFFLGIFLGLIFTAAAVLIIYYKQISEGMEDRARFEIMQNVGMSRAEVKSSINSQVLTVFFMPLILAGIHTAVAFPIVNKLLMVLSLTNTSLFINCTVVSFLVFAVIYGIVYLLTAKVYYKIVRDKGQNY